MKRDVMTYSLWPKGIFTLLAALLMLPGMAQEKARPRIAAIYTKIMEGPSYLDLSASARIERTNVKVPDIDLEVYYEVDGEEFPLGTVRTDANGAARYDIKTGAIRPDSTGLYILGASFAGNDAFRAASRSVEFRDGAIEASVQEVDSVNVVTATLKDVATDSTVADALIKVQVQRMFKPLIISEDMLMTDEAGSIQVPVPGDIPGMDGNLGIEIVIQDNDSYGTVKKVIDAPVGTPIVVESTFDQRSLWATSGKSPIFILVFTGLLIFGSWGLIAYLIVNLFKIAKN